MNGAPGCAGGSLGAVEIEVIAVKCEKKKQQQIPCGDDKQKGKSNHGKQKGKSNNNGKQKGKSNNNGKQKGKSDNNGKQKGKSNNNGRPNPLR